MPALALMHTVCMYSCALRAKERKGGGEEKVERERKRES